MFNADQAFNLYFGGSTVLDGVFGVVVPSTIHDVAADESTVKFYLRKIEVALSDAFGACTTVNQYGSWMGIREDNALVYSFYDTSDPDLANKFYQIALSVSSMQYGMQQECIGLLFNGKFVLWSKEQQDAYFVEQRKRTAEIIANASAR